MRDATRIAISALMDSDDTIDSEIRSIISCALSGRRDLGSDRELSLAEACSFLNCSRSTFLKMVYAGKVPRAAYGPKIHRYPLSGLQEFRRRALRVHYA